MEVFDDAIICNDTFIIKMETRIKSVGIGNYGDGDYKKDMKGCVIKKSFFIHDTLD
jgi:hypothetical protein